MKNLDRWIRGAVESMFEIKCFRKHSLTKAFIADYLSYTCVDPNHAWLTLSEKSQQALIGKELGRLMRKGKIEKVDKYEIISRQDFYILS